MDIQRVGVIGCGLMGAGIAQAAAEAGCQVWVKEVDDNLLAKGMDRIQGSWDHAISKGKCTEDQRKGWTKNLHGILDFKTLGGCELLVEAVPERLDLKLQAFTELDRVVGDHTILCTNTSSLPIAQLSSVLAPHHVPNLAGLHFFNPVPVMPLVEIIRTMSTSEDVLATLRAFIQKLGKTAIMAPNAPGFLVNRMLVPYLLDAMRCAEQRLATVEDLDTGMKLGLSHPMGPLQLSDYVGLDTLEAIAEVLFNAFGEPRFKAPLILRQLVASGHLGRKSGSGFYRWEGQKAVQALPL